MAKEKTESHMAQLVVHIPTKLKNAIYEEAAKLEVTVSAYTTPILEGRNSNDGKLAFENERLRKSNNSDYLDLIEVKNIELKDEILRLRKIEAMALLTKQACYLESGYNWVGGKSFEEYCSDIDKTINKLSKKHDRKN